VNNILVESPKGKRQFGRPEHELEDNIKTVLQETDVRMWTGVM
jgi:hypothetical protein